MHKDILVPLNLIFANQHISWHVRKLGSSPALINCSEASDRRLSARDGRLFIGNYKHYHLTLSLPLLSCSSPSRQKSNYPNARRTQFNVITHQGCCGIGRNTTCCRCRGMEESTSSGTVYYEAACRSSTDSSGACARRFKSAAHGDDGEKEEKEEEEEEEEGYTGNRAALTVIQQISTARLDNIQHHHLKSLLVFLAATRSHAVLSHQIIDWHAQLPSFKALPPQCSNLVTNFTWGFCQLGNDWGCPKVSQIWENGPKILPISGKVGQCWTMLDNVGHPTPVHVITRLCPLEQGGAFGLRRLGRVSCFQQSAIEAPPSFLLRLPRFSN